MADHGNMGFRAEETTELVGILLNMARVIDETSVEVEKYAKLAQTEGIFTEGTQATEELREAASKLQQLFPQIVEKCQNGAERISTVADALAITVSQNISSTIEAKERLDKLAKQVSEADGTHA